MSTTSLLAGGYVGKLVTNGIMDAIACLSNAVETATALATVFKQPAPEALERIEALCRMVRPAAAAPALDRQALCDGVWAAGVDEGIREVLALFEHVYESYPEKDAGVYADGTA